MKAIVLPLLMLATTALVSEGGASAAEIRVTLKPRAVVAAPHYVLGEVAEVTGDDRGLARQLSNLQVGLAPRPGYANRVPREELAHYVRLQYPQLSEQLVWGGANAVNVEIYAVSYKRRQIVDFAARELRTRLEAEGGEVELKPLDAEEPIPLPRGAVALSIRQGGEAYRPAKRLCVQVDVLVNGAFYRSVPVWFAVAVVRDVLKVRRDLPAGYTPTRDDFEVAEQDVAELAAAPLSTTVDVSGMRLKRPLAAGAVLQQGTLEAVPAIARGQDVTIEVAVEAIRLESKGVALSDAGIGQPVRVRTSANSVLVATAVAPGVVTLSVR